MKFIKKVHAICASVTGGSFNWKGSTTWSCLIGDYTSLFSV